MTMILLSILWNFQLLAECSPFQYFPSGSLAGYNSHKKWRSNSFYEDNNSPPFYSNSMVAVTTKCYQCSDHPKDRKKYSSCASDIIPIIQCQSEYCYTLRAVETGRELRECGNLKVKDIDLIERDDGRPVGEILSGVLDGVPSILSFPVCFRGTYSGTDKHGFKQVCCVGSLCNATSLSITNLNVLINTLLTSTLCYLLSRNTNLSF
ncbi:uncharacterized protein LOC142335243 isoform X2 [Convolutriloba macropyga]|uniref:uncharacterized protein LOC142335243 isoform X2 n=1 Tax=Convolutriloba macropyga TaxID=536237 RepID=UPI003F51B7B6